MKNNSIIYKFDKIDMMIIMLVAFDSQPRLIQTMSDDISKQMLWKRVHDLSGLGYLEKCEKDWLLTDKSKSLVHDLLLDFAMFHVGFDKISQQLA